MREARRSTVDRVVIAVPASVIDRIDFDPPLPEALRAAYAAVEYGHAAKLFVPLTREAVPERRPLGAGAVLELDRDRSGRRPARRQRIRRLGPRSRPASASPTGRRTWLESLERLRPDLALSPDDAVLPSWDDDPWVGAAYSCATPSVAAWAPAGPFHACGEHTHDTSRALMDGALASGLRAAQEVLDAG